MNGGSLLYAERERRDKREEETDMQLSFEKRKSVLYHVMKELEGRPGGSGKDKIYTTTSTTTLLHITTYKCRNNTLIYIRCTNAIPC